MYQIVLPFNQFQSIYDSSKKENEWYREEIETCQRDTVIPNSLHYIIINEIGRVYQLLGTKTKGKIRCD